MAPVQLVGNRRNGQFKVLVIQELDLHGSKSRIPESESVVVVAFGLLLPIFELALHAVQDRRGLCQRGVHVRVCKRAALAMRNHEVEFCDGLRDFVEHRNSRAKHTFADCLDVDTYVRDLDKTGIYSRAGHELNHGVSSHCDA